MPLNFFSLKVEQWLKRLTLSWKFVSDQKFQWETKSRMSSKYTSVYGSHMNSHCEWCNTKNRNISFEYPLKSLHKSSNPKKVPAKINLPKTIHVSKNHPRILSAPLLKITGFQKRGVQTFCLTKPTKSGPLMNMLPVRTVKSFFRLYKA